MSKQLTSHFYSELAEIRRLEEILAILDWDRAVNLPNAASEARAEQVQYISVKLHEKKTSDSLYDLTNKLLEQRAELTADDLINLRETKKKLDKQRKLPVEFVSRQSLLQSVSYDTWVVAKPKNDFAAVQNNLANLITLAKEEAELLGYNEHPYDALLDHYEPDAKLSQVKPLLLKLGEGLSKILPEISQKFALVNKPSGSFHPEKQHALSLSLLKKIGYDMNKGRLDISPHPFSTCLGYGDWRITTRYLEDDLFSAIYSTLHEAGHAFYEMGLKKEFRGTPLGSYVSLGIHESQSRLWENLIGRSLAFAEFLTPLLQAEFPSTFSKLGPKEVWSYINKVKPSLVRVESDEVSYSLHIIIRMLLEEALISGDLNVADAPAAWNELYKKYLGVDVPSNTRGIMQDVHWYQGAFGYFPTYALGNLYGIVMLKTAQAAGAGLESDTRKGDFSKLHDWLRLNVHESGMRLYGPELLKKISGQTLSEKPFLEYITAKFEIN